MKSVALGFFIGHVLTVPCKGEEGGLGDLCAPISSGYSGHAWMQKVLNRASSLGSDSWEFDPISHVEG